MQQYKKILGKVMMTAEDAWDIDKPYDPISLVTDEETDKSYISRKDVPVGIQINNREYWQPVASSGIIDNGVIILNRKNKDGQVPIYDLKSAAESVAIGDRRAGVILGFLGFNTETDIAPSWKLYQYNDVSPSNWTNIQYWLPMDYTNKYAGWFDNEEALYDNVNFPKIGMYAYVGNSVTSAIIYRCYVDKIWQSTEDKAFSDVVNLADEEDITTKQNKLKFKDKEYNPAQFNGLGKIYLRKNMINGKNILTQAMMQSTNTIYIIQYDYDLQGHNITIPEYCTLDFQGGSFKNGQIDGNGCTLLNYPNYNIFNDVLISNFNIDYLDVRWFGAIEGHDATDAFQYCVNSFNKNVGIPINVVGHYVLTRTIQCDCGIMMFNNTMFNFTMDEDRMVEGGKIKHIAQIDVNLDEGYDCAFLIDTYGNSGKDATLCIKGVNFVNIKYLPNFKDFVADAEKTVGYFIEQEYIKNNSPYKEVLFHYSGGGRPTYGFKFEDCKFDSFEKAIYFSGAGTTSGTTAYNINIDFCEFRRCNYAVYAKQTNEGKGTATFAGFQFTRNRLRAPSKIYVDELYGACSYEDSVIEGFYQEGDILNNATYPIIYNSISNGGIEIGGMYLEHNTGNFVFEGLDNSAETSQVYNVAKTAHASLSFKDSKSSIYGLAESSITRHLYIKCKDLTIKDIPTQSVPYVFKFDNCTLEESVVTNSSIRPLNFSNIVLNETEKGNMIGSVCIKTKNYTTINLNDAITKNIDYYFTPETGFTHKGTMGFEGSINRYYGQSNPILAPINYYNDNLVSINNKKIFIVFYKTIFTCKIEFIGDLVGDNYEIIDEYDCVSAEGFTMIRAEFADNVQKRIKGIRISKYAENSGSRYYISDIVGLNMAAKIFGDDAPSLKDACVLLNTEDIQYTSISGLKIGVGSNVLYVNSPIWYNGKTWVDGLGRIYNKKRGATKDRPNVINSIGYTYFDTTIGKPVFFKEGTVPTYKIEITSGFVRPSTGDKSVTITISFENTINRILLSSNYTDKSDFTAEDVAKALYSKIASKFNECYLEGSAITIVGECYGNHSASFTSSNSECTASVTQITAGSAIWVDAVGVEV